MVVVVHALHDFEKPVAWMVNLKKYLRPGGTLAVVDVDPERSHNRHFWPRARILECAAQAGYDLVKIVDDPIDHLFVILRPRPPLSPGEDPLGKHLAGYPNRDVKENGAWKPNTETPPWRGARYFGHSGGAPA
jgi:hypothetical protein